MKTKTITLYNYDELPTSEAKEKAREWCLEGSLDEWWESTYEDAATVGLKITSFDIDRGIYIKGALTTSVWQVAQNVKAQHGASCDSYKLAEAYLTRLAELQEAVDSAVQREESPEDIEWSQEDEKEELRDEFERALLEEYLSILRKEYEYQTSAEVVEENLRANEYTFTETGKRED